MNAHDRRRSASQESPHRVNSLQIELGTAAGAGKAERGLREKLDWNRAARRRGATKRRQGDENPGGARHEDEVAPNGGTVEISSGEVDLVRSDDGLEVAQRIGHGGEQFGLAVVFQRSGIGEAGTDGEQALIVAAELMDEFGDNGTWTDHAHFAAEDIPKLRQLIELVLTHPAAGRSDAGIGPESVGGTGNAVRHGAQLPYLERTEVTPHAGLAKEDGALRIQPDEDSTENQGRKSEQEEAKGTENVQATFHYVVSKAKDKANTGTSTELPACERP